MIKSIQIDREQLKKTIIVALIPSLLVIITSYYGVLNNFKNSFFDLNSRLFNPESPIQLKDHINKVVIVEIDQRSLDDVNREGINWPWPRQIYAPIIEYLSEAEAVFIDTLYTESSSYGKEDDEILAKAIRNNANVYLPVVLTNDFYEITDDDKTFLNRISIPEDNLEISGDFKSVITPINTLKNSIVSSGNVTIAPDSDGVYRRMPFFFRLNQYIIPHFLINFLLKRNVIDIKNNQLYIKQKKAPFVNGHLILKYYSNEKPFTSYSASQILKAYLNEKSGKPTFINKNFFRNKIALIGFTAPGLLDLRSTPVASISTGIMIHATTLDNFYNNSFIKEIPRIILYLLVVVISFVCTFFILKSPSLLRNISLFIMFTLIIFILDICLFKLSIYLNIVDPMNSLILSFIIATAYSYATEGKKRELTEKTLLQYMDKQIASYLLNNPMLIKPGGIRKNVTIFFADIAGFTSIAEKISPEETSNMLIEVLNLFTDKIIEYHGVIDKYIGDCVMAFWGAPLESDNDEVNACSAALNSIKSLALVNNEFHRKRLPKLSFRVGINTGDAIVGNLGSHRVFDYTVVGDSVNLASRIEALNKQFNTDILISGNTLVNTGDVFLTRYIGAIEVKGKSLSTDIYHLIDFKSSASADSKNFVESYNMSMSSYNNQKFEEALESFNNLLINYPDDGPTKFYIHRCIEFLGKKSLTSDWKVLKFDIK